MSNPNEISIVVNMQNGRFKKFEGADVQGKLPGQKPPGYGNGNDPPPSKDEKEKRWERTQGVGLQQTKASVGAASSQQWRCSWVWHNGAWHWACVQV